MLSRLWQSLSKSMQSIPAASILRERLGLVETQKAHLDAENAALKAKLEGLEQQLSDSQQECRRLQSWVNSLSQQIDDQGRAAEDGRGSTPGGSVGY